MAKQATAEVISDLSTDPSAICPGCGQAASDHKLSCRTVSRKGEKRGGKDDCEFCGGPGHNAREKKAFQAQACAFRIVLGDAADTTSFADGAAAFVAAMAAAPFRYVFDGASGSAVKLVAHPGLAAKAKAA